MNSGRLVLAGQQVSRSAWYI